MAFNRWRKFAAVYAQSLYVVRLPRSELILRPRRRDLSADRRLWREAGVRKSWVMLSAANPHSRALPESWNTSRFNRLKRLLAVYGQPMFHSEGRAPKAQWPIEHGFLVCDIPLQRAKRLGRYFGQNALLAGGPGRRPKIVWL